jgi:g-D-glutamyl-meso-diaminopimelate peptidase
MPKRRISMQTNDSPIVDTDTPYNSRLNRSTIKALAARYPFLEIFVIGYSVMGTPLLGLKIGKGEKHIFYNASFHANESITTPILLKFAEEYAKAYDAKTDLYGTDAEALFSEYTLYLLPMVNPDGVDLVNGFLESGPYYQMANAIGESYPDIAFPSGWKANIEGVDLNLQFPAGWEQAREIKYAQGYTVPAPRDYVGERPLSAPESRAVYRFTLQHEFRLILAYHTQGEVIYWKYLDYEPADSRRIAFYFSEVSGYEVEETPLTSGYAGYKDWFIMEYNRPGYTIEAGRGVNPLPMSQFAQIYEDNKGILLGGMIQI